MRETFVRLLCSRCSKGWARSPSKLPHPDASFSCPDCGLEGSTSEFTRTRKDLEVLRQFSD